MANVAKKQVVGNAVVFSFFNGETLNCDVSELPREIVEQLALHGIKQKVGDSYAGAESIGMAVNSAREVWKNLKAGIWATKATGGKIIEALMRATGESFDDCLEKWQAMTPDEQKELRKHPQIKFQLAEMEAERQRALAKADGNADDLKALF